MIRHFPVLTAIAFVFAQPTWGADATPPKPNIVFLYCDDAGYGDFGCFGNTVIRTPNVDRMATEGTRFTDFYVAQGVCSASRTSLLTGCYPNRLGILGALNPKSKNGISDHEKTIADLLKTRGYATAIYGKWHLGHHPQFLPTRHGFDDWFGLPYSNDMGAKPNAPNNPPVPLFFGEKVIETNPDMNHITERYTEHAVGFIRKSARKNKEQPFFLYVPYTMPHVPLGASEKFHGKSKAGLYGDVIEEIDWSVGQILATLKELGLDEKTLVIFSSDNGPWLGAGKHGGSAGPLREGKGTAWEGGVREPCVVRWPGQVPAGRVCHEPWMTIDVLPTLARLTGAELPPLPIDGKDAWPLLHGEPGARSPQEAYYFYWDRGLHAVRSGKWKLHFPHDYRAFTGPAGTDDKVGGYKPAHTDLALYDLEADIGEQTNVADQHPDVVNRLEALAEKMREDLGDGLTKRVGKGVRKPGTVSP
jgi:arylsulfatase A-like enzyme